MQSKRGRGDCSMTQDFYIVHKNILPEYYDRVVMARDLIIEENESVSNACKKMGISRSTFYKYKDSIFKPSAEYGKKVLLHFTLDNLKGILSNILNYVADSKCNIVAIHQEAPIRNRAYVTMTIDVIEMEKNLNELIDSLRKRNGVINVELVAVE